MFGLSDVTVFRVLVVSMATNAFMAHQVLTSCIFVTSAFCNKPSFVKKNTRQHKISRATVSLRIGDEIINIALSCVALTCTCIYPVSGAYARDAVPRLLEVAICLNTARYAYRVWTQATVYVLDAGELRWWRLLHDVSAALFHVYILLSNHGWWFAIIGNFIEMESLILTTHYLLRLIYRAYVSIERCCLLIQIISAVTVRLLMPHILLVIFTLRLHRQAPAAETYCLAGLLFAIFSFYGISALVKRCTKYRATRKRTAASNAGCSNNSDDAARAPRGVCLPGMWPGAEWVNIPGLWPTSKKQPSSWSMVGCEEISSPQSPSRKSPMTSALTSAEPVRAKKTVHFVQNVTCLDEQQPVTATLKATANVNTDSQPSSKDYTKGMILKDSQSDAGS